MALGRVFGEPLQAYYQDKPHIKHTNIATLEL